MEKDYTTFHVIEADSIINLESLVSQNLNHGYKISGNMVIRPLTSGEKGFIYCQPMTRTTKV